MGVHVVRIIVEKYLWLNKTTLVAIYDKDDNLVQRFEYGIGNTPASFTQDGNKYYITSDHLGSPRTISDDSGNVLKAIEYDSFGNVISDTNPALEIPFGFAGGLHDKDTNLIRFGYRDFDPETGRWTARDPIGFAGGDMNLYGYVASDPINFIDLKGLAANDFNPTDRSEPVSLDGTNVLYREYSVTCSGTCPDGTPYEHTYVIPFWTDGNQRSAEQENARQQMLDLKRDMSHVDPEVARRLGFCP